MNSQTKTILVTAALVAVIAGLLLWWQFQANARLQDQLDAAQKQATTLKAQQQKLKTQLADQLVDLQIQEAAQRTNEQLYSSAGTGEAASAETHPKGNPHQPSPGVYSNEPKMMNDFTKAGLAALANGGQPSKADFIHLMYDDFFVKLQFTPGQIDTFTQILLNKQDAQAAVRQQYEADNPIPSGLTEAQLVAQMTAQGQQEMALPQIQAVQQAANQQLQQMLGEDDYNYYQDYSADTYQQSMVENVYGGELAAANLPSLTLDQNLQLASIIYQNVVNANNDPSVAAQQFPQVLQQASEFLSPEQIQVLQQNVTKFVNPQPKITRF